MNVKHKKKKSLTSARWSGGTTTQLAIYPEDGDYAKGAFDWRLSSAVVAVEKSTFTKLPNTNRIIMILEGTLLLSHKDRYEKTLKKFEQDSFSGSWETVSEGMVTDFNLMTRGKAVGRLSHKIVTGNASVGYMASDLESGEVNKLYGKGLYCSQGSGLIEIEGDYYPIGQGDLIMVEMKMDEAVGKSMIMSGEMTLVIVDISY